MKILSLLLLLCLLPFGLFDDPYSERRWAECLKNYQNQNLTFAYFSQHHSGYKTYRTEASTEVSNYSTIALNHSDHEQTITRYEDKFLLLCYCESNMNQAFFLSPYLHTNYPNNTVPGTFQDAMVLCMNNSDGYQDSGIYDENEIFDLMLFERIVSVPNSILNPFVNANTLGEHRKNERNEIMCYDLFGFQTKDIFGQRTCLLAVEFSPETNYKYSGPLLGNAMIDFLESEEYGNENNFNMIDHCFSTTNNTILSNEDDYCFYQNDMNRNIFQCCSTQSSQPKLHKAVIIDGKKLCMPGYFESFENSNSTIIYNTTMEEYIKNYVNVACSVKITIKGIKDRDDFDFNVTFGSQSDCTEKKLITVNSDFCTLKDFFPKYVTLTKCCTNGHFCNQGLVPPYVTTKNYCWRHGNMGLFLSENITRCEFFWDFQLNADAYLILDYNAIIPKQKIYNMTDKKFFSYLKIIKADPSSCGTPRYEVAGEYRPFSHIICEGFQCDYYVLHIKNYYPRFKCEKLDKTKLGIENENDAISYSTTYSEIYGWICYVEIKYDNDGNTVIQAGELKDIGNHLKCLENGRMSRTFCCIHVFNMNQSETLCTVKKMIEKYNARNIAEINNGNFESGNGNGYFTNCFIRDLPHDSCLAEAGCFETRMLEYSKNSDAIEPAGCVDNTEKYVIQDISMSSISLGCRSEENSNKCSVIQTPNGQQRILCCCNGKECENDFKNLPKQIGKNVSSFRGPK